MRAAGAKEFRAVRMDRLRAVRVRGLGAVRVQGPPAIPVPAYGLVAGTRRDRYSPDSSSAILNFHEQR
ncbi:hypothetical protein GCM10023334_123780 [Nonomuraea thailandensis]